ncbi:hypothetical protein KHA90_23245 [Flavobacterium psychroterrae]|uniref:Uncharacterized protein n=1 Tax=Flavobacterium psychroterrae TaxID=2133767 RepID=A0ABS5PJB6_9FLAO|nr:hypothetical protein [Flavobacterium psychroterrae]MBS7233933.1 hypothetical protein [Flavobacterium psychroterrae]
MKTTEKLSFQKLENEFLENILRQLVNQYTIIQIFFTRHSSSVFSYLIINLDNYTVAQNLQQSKWVRKVKERYQINIAFISSSRLHHYYSLGCPFIAFYCRASAVIYQNKEIENSIFITGQWKKYKKRFKVNENNFHHDHDLHMCQIKNLISEGTSNCIFTSYARLIEYDLDYLEELYCGNKSSSLSLDQRITNLIEYIPNLQKYFVRNSHNKYYLIDLFVKAKEATADDEAIYKEEMYEAVGIAQQNLYRLIEERFDELKKLIKKGSSENNDVSCQIEKKPKDIIISLTIEAILKSIEVEQIYLYRQITYGEKTTYYLMLITIGASNEKLKSITQSLKSKIGEKYDFVLLSHSRYWIQANLYQNQSFFFNIIRGEYLIFSSNKYLPDFHWEIPHKPYHADLYFYYKATKNIALQFSTIANNEQENYQGLESLFTLFFLSFCRTYIFVKTYYLPNYVSSQTLWELCIYADAGIQKYNYLIEQFWTDFFPYINRHLTLHHNLSMLKKGEVEQMNIIVEKLIDELHNLVVVGRLLLEVEED